MDEIVGADEDSEVCSNGSTISSMFPPFADKMSVRLGKGPYSAKRKMAASWVMHSKRDVRLMCSQITNQ